jgi:hypothetical protein
MLVATASAPRAQAGGRDFYAAPFGLASNDGTKERPLTLSHALSAASPLRPGDRLWLRGGTYRGTFISELKGTAAAPIVVRQYAGERAIIDSAPYTEDALWVNGAYTWFWGFEIMSSEPTRHTVEEGSFPRDLKRGTGVMVQGPGTKIIHLVIHDMKNGIGTWSTAPDTEIYGNLVYHNGWEAPDRPHGHGIYAQNRDATLVMRDNIIFNQYGAGIHAYGSGDAFLNNFRIDGNTIFQSGILWSGSANSLGANLLVGGGVLAQNPTIVSNVAYQPRRSGGNYLGYNVGCTNLVAEGNYFAGGYPVIFTNCTGRVVGNTFAGIVNPDYRIAHPENTWIHTDTTAPTGTHVYVRPSPYEPRRANITILNWNKTNPVAVNVSASGLRIGDAFQVRDAQNFHAAPVVTGVYSGAPVSIPMSGLSVVRPVGNVTTIPTHTAPELGTFVIMPVAAPSLPAPGAPSNLRVVK